MSTEATKENAPLAGEARQEKLCELREQFRGNEVHQQEPRLLAALNLFPVSTLEARRYLDMPHPAGRVASLRRKGWRIETLMIRERTEAGVPHSFALYVLRGGQHE